MILKSKFVFLVLIVGLLSACAELAKPGASSANANSLGNERARAHTELGAAYLQQNKLEIAQDEFQQAIEASPSYALAYNGLAMVQAALGEDAQAEESFKMSIQLQPNSSESHNNYGNFLCARSRYDESIAEFLAAVKNPLYSTPNLAYANAGICADRKKDTKSAEIYLRKALEIEPLTYSAAQQLADIQFRRGDAVAADKTLQNALLGNPTAETLWLGVRIARTLGNKDNEASYALLLRKQYPDSMQTKQLLSGK